MLRLATKGGGAFYAERAPRASLRYCFPDHGRRPLEILAEKLERRCVVHSVVMVVAGSVLSWLKCFQDLCAEQGGDFQHLHVVGQGVVRVADDVLRGNGGTKGPRIMPTRRFQSLHWDNSARNGAGASGLRGFNPAHGLSRNFSKASRPVDMMMGFLEVTHELDEGRFVRSKRIF